MAEQTNINQSEQNNSPSQHHQDTFNTRGGEKADKQTALPLPGGSGIKPDKESPQEQGNLDKSGKPGVQDKSGEPSRTMADVRRSFEASTSLSSIRDYHVKTVKIDDIDLDDVLFKRTGVDPQYPAFVEFTRKFGPCEAVILSDQKNKNGKWKPISDTRLIKAVKDAGQTKITAFIKKADSAESVMIPVYLDLLHQPYNPIDIAERLQYLNVDCGQTHEQIGKSIGRSRSYVSGTIKLNKADDVTKDLARAGKLSHSVCLVLVGAKNESMLAIKAAQENLTVKEVEYLVADRTKPKPPLKTKKDEEITALEDDVRMKTGCICRISHNGRTGKGTITLPYNNLAARDAIIRCLSEHFAGYLKDKDDEPDKIAEPDEVTESDKIAEPDRVTESDKSQ